MEELKFLTEAKCINSCDGQTFNLEISMVYTSTVAVVHSINELLKISPSSIFLEFSIFSLQKYGDDTVNCKSLHGLKYKLKHGMTNIPKF